jgi:hypothetical protein
MEISGLLVDISLPDPVIVTVVAEAGRTTSVTAAAINPIAEIPRKLLRDVWFVISTSDNDIIRA